MTLVSSRKFEISRWSYESPLLNGRTDNDHFISFLVESKVPPFSFSPFLIFSPSSFPPSFPSCFFFFLYFCICYLLPIILLSLLSFRRINSFVWLRTTSAIERRRKYFHNFNLGNSYYNNV